MDLLNHKNKEYDDEKHQDPQDMFNCKKYFTLYPNKNSSQSDRTIKFGTHTFAMDNPSHDLGILMTSDFILLSIFDHKMSHDLTQLEINKQQNIIEIKYWETEKSKVIAYNQSALKYHELPSYCVLCAEKSKPTTGTNNTLVNVHPECFWKLKMPNKKDESFFQLFYVNLPYHISNDKFITDKLIVSILLHLIILGKVFDSMTRGKYIENRRDIFGYGKYKNDKTKFDWTLLLNIKYIQHVSRSTYNSYDFLPPRTNPPIDWDQWTSDAGMYVF